MAKLTRNYVETEVSIMLDNLFTDLDTDAQQQGMKPSEVALLLDQTTAWGLGDDYREWFEESGDLYE